jgi:toxin ParE1/3/4
MAQVVWTATALDDLDGIGEFIAKDSLRYAELTVSELFNCVFILEKSPRLGRKVPEFDIDSIRELIKGNYRIIYRIVESYRIDILTVHHSSRHLFNNDLFSG